MIYLIVAVGLLVFAGVICFGPKRQKIPNDPALLKPATGRDVLYFRNQNRTVLFLAVFAVLVSIGGNLVVRHIDDTRGDQRDDAIKYQRCVTTANQAIQTNANTAEDERRAKLRERFYVALAVLAVKSKTGTFADRFELKEATDALSKSARAALKQPRQPVVDCASTYPDGFKATKKLGDVVPTIDDPHATNPSTATTATSPTQ